MADIIQLLPDSIANQIAAGEVVQRPASVVKELMENSIDAGSQSITVIIKEAGKALVQVIDNGMGMSETDARLSFERHATSKIKKAEDLFTLRTMGFRGEALASIAAVAQVEMKTRQAHHELGTLLSFEGSAVTRQEQAAMETGTSICVRNLFFNIPARRNFLKSNAVEMKHIMDEFQRLALAYPEKSFMLIQGDQMVYDLKPGKLSQRIVALLGKSYQNQLASCQEETELLSVSGYIGRPEAARKSRGEQFLFVNKRYIKSNYLNHAVTLAFEGLLPVGNYPFYVMFMEIDPRHIDVNVHPTKTEIKFDDERAVYAVVRAAVRQALGAHNLVPAIDFQADVNVLSKLTTDERHTRQVYFDEQFGNALSRSNLSNWEKAFDQDIPPLQQATDQGSALRFESAMNHKESIPVHSREMVAFQLLNRYIVREVKDGLMIMDQQAAHERVLYEKFLSHIRGGTAGNSQQSLFPQPVELSPPDFALVMEMAKEIRSLGFVFDLFGKSAVLVSGIPADVGGSEKELFEGLLTQFKINQELTLPANENLARSLARRASIKAGQRLQQEEVEALVRGLFACTNPNFSPDGQPTFFIFDEERIGNCFNQ